MPGVTKLLMILLLLAGLVGCASSAKAPDYVAEEYKSKAFKIRRVALATNLSPPEIEVVNTGLTRGQGAAKGAAGGAATGAAYGAAIGISTLSEANECGDLAIVCVGGSLALTGILAAGGTVVGAVVGTVAGASNGQSADVLAEAAANAKSTLTLAHLQVELLEAAKRYGRDNTDFNFIRAPNAGVDGQNSKIDYKTLSSESIDVVQEIELLRVKLEDNLEIQAQARLISVQTVTLLREGHYSFVSEKRASTTWWMVDDASPLKGAIERGLATIAEDVIEDSFPSYLTKRPRLSGIHYIDINTLRELCRSADKDNTEAQYRLGLLYEMGSGTVVPKDPVKAYMWYRLAASRGDYTMASEQAGRLQEKQTAEQIAHAEYLIQEWKPGQCEQELIHDIPHDVKKKNSAHLLIKDIDLFCPKAELGRADAQTQIGELYYVGSYGLFDKDLIQAYVWYSLGSKNGNSYAASLVEKVRRELTPEQMLLAEDRLERWEPGRCRMDLLTAASINDE